MTCDECRQQLILAEDNGPAPAPAREHLERCLACQEFAQDGERLRKEVRLLAEIEQAPQELREQVQDMFYKLTSSKEKRSRLWAGVAAGIVLLALTGYGLKWYFVQRSLTPDHLAREFIFDHLNYLPGKEEIVSPSAHEVENWFQGRVDFPVRVPEVPSAVLQDARVCDIAGRKAALLHYRREEDQTLVSLFVTPEPKSFETQKRPIEVWESNQGLNSALWCHRGLVYSLVAALDTPSLQQIAEAIRRQSP